MALIIGLTGGIGSGKTTTAELFSALGSDIVDTDVIAHELTQPGGGGMTAIRHTFGEQLIAPDGSLDRQRMRNLAFSDSSSRRKLEAILHPLIRIEVACRIRLFSAPYGMIVVPLLLETGSYREVIERVLVVDCGERDQIARATARAGMDEQAVRAIMAAQISRKERLLQADDVITNDADLPHLERQVNVLHRKYLDLASRSS